MRLVHDKSTAGGALLSGYSILSHSLLYAVNFHDEYSVVNEFKYMTYIFDLKLKYMSLFRAALLKTRAL